MNILQYLTLHPIQRAALHLNLGLKNYGLCPKDWTIIPQKNNCYSIINNEEPNFIFEGEAKTIKGKTTWNRIILKSI